MEIVKPWIEVENYDAKRILKNIERACRTCYRSEDLITEDSYKKLIEKCITRGHESILEHEKITVRIRCDVGFYKDITRHRVGTAYSIESTRYCNYSKDKFTNNIKFIDPIFIKDEKNYEIWKNAMAELEKSYKEMANNGAVVDELRMLLPHSTAAEVTMTCNMREWKHILGLRCSKMVHPSIRQILIPLLLKFKEDFPEIFASVPYDEEFPKSWYAELRSMKD
jgi:thymidylate synthase (FAD)